MKRLKSNTMEVYVKGAPEVMVEICQKESCMVLEEFQLVGSDHAVNSPTGLR